MYYIIILNWNGWHDTQKCIESIIKKTKRGNYTIVLIDNGSKSEEIDLIETFCKENFKEIISENKDYFLHEAVQLSANFKECHSKDKIIFIKNNENLGFAKGNNVALIFLQNLGEKYAVLLNNDTELENDALGKMYEFLSQSKDPQLAAVIPQIRYYKPNDIIWNCGGSISKFGVRKYDYAFQNIKNVPQIGSKKVDYGTGCALMMNLEKTGILSEKYFFGEEDMEFAFRLKKMNLSIYCIYDSVVYHKVGSSRDQISKNLVGKMAYHYSQRVNNLKANLSYPVWLISLLMHMLSSIRLLFIEDKFSFRVFLKLWKVIVGNSSKNQFLLSDFKNITRYFEK